MATVVSLSQVDQVIVANRAATFLVTVSNTGSTALTLSNVSVSESTESDAQIGQPNYLVPQMPLGFGNPIILASGSVSYAFDVIFPSPNGPGPSPNSPGPLGVAGMMNGQPADNSFTLQAQAQTSDGSVAAAALPVSVLSAIAPFPRPEGGALQFTQGSNIVNGLIMGVL